MDRLESQVWEMAVKSCARRFSRDRRYLALVVQVFEKEGGAYRYLVMFLISSEKMKSANDFLSYQNRLLVDL